MVENRRRPDVEVDENVGEYCAEAAVVPRTAMAAPLTTSAPSAWIRIVRMGFRPLIVLRQRPASYPSRYIEEFEIAKAVGGARSA